MPKRKLSRDQQHADHLVHELSMALRQRDLHQVRRIFARLPPSPPKTSTSSSSSPSTRSSSSSIRRFLLHAHDANGQTLLQVAVTAQHAGLVQFLLQQGAPVDALSEYGDYSALDISSLLGHYEICQILLQHGANVDSPNPQQHQHQPHGGCYHHDTGDDEDEDDDMMVVIGRPLLKAIQHGHTRIVQLLLQYGATTHNIALDEHGSVGNPLVPACQYYNGQEDGRDDDTEDDHQEENKHEIVQLLLKHGVSVNAPSRMVVVGDVADDDDDLDNEENDPDEIEGEEENEEDDDDEVSFASSSSSCSHSSTEGGGAVVDTDTTTAATGAAALLSSSHQHHHHQTWPLLEACVRGNLPLARLLLQHGANPSIQEPHQDVMPLLLAISSNHLPLLRLLLKQGAAVQPVTAVSNLLRHPLIFALLDHKWEAARLLIQHGGGSGGATTTKNTDYVNCAINGAITPLFLMSFKGHVREAGFLVQAGADVNRPCGKYGFTPLMVASEGGHVQVVRELLHRGQARVDARNRHDQTALGLAHAKGHMHIVYELLRASPQVWPDLQQLFCRRRRHRTEEGNNKKKQAPNGSQN